MRKVRASLSEPNFCRVALLCSKMACAEPNAVSSLRAVVLPTPGVRASRSQAFSSWESMTEKAKPQSGLAKRSPTLTLSVTCNTSAYDRVSKVRNTISRPLRSLGSLMLGRALSVLSSSRSPSFAIAIT